MFPCSLKKLSISPLFPNNKLSCSPVFIFVMLPWSQKIFVVVPLNLPSSHSIRLHSLLGATLRPQQHLASLFFPPQKELRLCSELHQEVRWVLALEQHGFMLFVWWDDANNAVYFGAFFGVLYKTYLSTRFCFQVLHTSYSTVLETGYC